MNRVALIFFGNGENFGRHGLSVLGHIGEYRLDILAEAHIEHFVRLVEDDGAQVFEFESTSADMVHNASGSTDDDIRAAFELHYLTFHARASVDGTCLH